MSLDIIEIEANDHEWTGKRDSEKIKINHETAADFSCCLPSLHSRQSRGTYSEFDQLELVLKTTNNTEKYTIPIQWIKQPAISHRIALHHKQMRRNNIDARHLLILQKPK